MGGKLAEALAAANAGGAVRGGVLHILQKFRLTHKGTAEGHQGEACIQAGLGVIARADAAHQNQGQAGFLQRAGLLQIIRFGGRRGNCSR